MTRSFYASLSLLFLVSTTVAQAGVAEGIKTLESGDIAGAVKEFQAAFEAGEADGAFYIGRLFEIGLGTGKDMRRAAELYAAAVSKKSAKAENRLGKTMEVEILREALSKAGSKNRYRGRSCCRRTVPDEGRRQIRLAFPARTSWRG